MLGHGATGQFAIGQVDFGTPSAPEFIGPDKWMVGWANPVWAKAGLSAGRQQALAFNPAPIVSFGWFGGLSEPVRQRPRNPAALYPYFSFQPAPSPFVPTGWFNWLSEPVRQKVGLKAHLHPFQTQAPQFIPAPATLIEGWFTWLSEPKRFPKGLGAPYQLAYTAHPRVLPNPNVTVTIAATEGHDDPLIAVNVVKSNPAVSAKVGVTEIGNGLSYTAVIESP